MHSSASGLFFFPRPQIEPQSPPAPQPPSCFLGGASWREAAASNDSTGGLLTRASGLPLPTMPSHHALRLSPRWRPISRRGGGQRRLPAATQRSPGRGRCGSSGLFQPPLSSSPPFVLLLPPLPISGAPPVVLLKTLISGTVTTGDIQRHLAQDSLYMCELFTHSQLSIVGCCITLEEVILEKADKQQVQEVIGDSLGSHCV